MAAIAALALALATAGCGDPDTPEQPPAELLRTAAENPPASGELEIGLTAELDGESLLAGTTSADLSGPFVLGEGAALPRFELDGAAEVAGFGVDGALISTGEDAFVDFFGELYRVGPERIAAIERRLTGDPAGAGLGLDLAGWIASPSYAGTDEVAGTETERIEGTLRAGVAAAELAELAEALGAPPALGELATGAGSGPAEAWVAYEDETIRRIRVQFPFTVPPGLRTAARGIAGGSVALDAEVSDIGADVEIGVPAGGGAKPIEQLIADLRGLARLGGL